MSSIEKRKLDLIASLIKETNEDVLKKIEHALPKHSAKKDHALGGFSTILTAKELDEFEKNIKNGCGQ